MFAFRKECCTELAIPDLIRHLAQLPIIALWDVVPERLAAR